MKSLLTMKIISAICLLWILACGAQTSELKSSPSIENSIGDKLKENRTYNFQRASVTEWSSTLSGKKVGAVVNHSSYENDNRHLIDHLLENQIKLTAIFAPEHGFKGKADAGESIVDGKYKGIPLISLYGKNKKPSPEHLANVDVLIFDMQDVGARFYTYISTMHYVMEAAAEHGKKVIILDRPNPNGHYVDGPIREEGFESFVGMHPIPIVHGMTIGELAQMINSEGWLKGGVKCELEIIKLENYSHQLSYELPIKPSPNLPNQRSIYLYPSLCLFEGTEISVGRGTNTQFQVWGHPDLTNQFYSFTPVPGEGSKYPKHQDKVCHGQTLTPKSAESIFENEAYFNLHYILAAYNAYPDKANFFLKNLFFDKLAGTDKLRKQIISGMDAEQIKATWKTDLAVFKKKRLQYLLYP